MTAALCALAVGFGATAAEAPGTAPDGRAGAFAIQIRIPGLAPITHAPVLTRGGSANAGGGFATQPDPAIASLLGSDASTGVTTTADGARGDATTRAAGVTLLDGLITAESVSTQAAAGATASGQAASGLRSEVVNLVVGGQPIEATPNRIVAIAGVGDLVVREEVDAVRGPHAARTFAIALHLRIRQDYRGLPAGTEILVGYADAGAAVPDPTSTDAAIADPLAVPATTAPAPLAGDVGSGSGIDTAAPAGTESNPPVPADRQEQLLSGGYMFPVLGATSRDFSDDWGAPRATTGSHQGIDVFAASGTPLLAVQDGTVYRVGWNTLGGRRLWLADKYGNHFYYAHLAGFSPLAREGATVQRGDVLGFVGTSGDAQGTPPHLHFQIHPGGQWSVRPYAFLMTWLTGVRQPLDVPTAVAPDPAGAPTTTAPTPKPKPKPKPPVTAPFETLPIETAPAPPPATTAPAPPPATTAPALPPATTAPAPPTTTETPATTDTTTTPAGSTAITGTGTAFTG